MLHLLISSLVASASAAAQSVEPEPPRPLRTVPPGTLTERYLDDASRLVGRALLANRAYERLEILCDSIGPRLTGTPQAEAAVAWCLETMKSDGFHDVRGQPVTVPVWRRGHCSLRLLGPREQELAACALGGSVGTPDGPLVGTVVEVGSFDHLRELGTDGIAGRIVFYNHEMSPSTRTSSDYGAKVGMRTQGALEAAKYGAIASVTKSVGTDRSRLPHTGAMHYDPRGDRIPAVAIAFEDAEMLHRLLQRGEELVLSLDLGCETLPDQESHNVIAEVRGRERPEEVVVIGGHLDSWDLGTGAIDDGSGCVIAWEAARLLLELGMIPRRTVRVVLFMNEENGLRGAHAYAEAHEEVIASHVAAIEADSGAGRPWGFSCGGPRPAVERVEEIGRLLQGLGAAVVRPGGGGGADISPLSWRGVPCLGLRQDSTYYFHWHHTPADTLDKVEEHELARNVAAMAVMAYVLADMETPLARRE